MASRHLSRSIVMQSLYEWDFYGRKEGGLDVVLERNITDFGPGLEDLEFVRQLAHGEVKHMVEIDNIIEKAAPEWPIAQIPIIDRNVLRIGLFELLYSNKEEEGSTKVGINRGKRIAKNFSGQISGKFINGVLGTVFKQLEEK